MEITLFTTDAFCTEIIKVKSFHISMFEKNKLDIHFLSGSDDMINFIKACIENYVLIQIQGSKVSIIPENNNYQRVRFRFDSN
jgi:hypothetical protein